MSVFSFLPLQIITSLTPMESTSLSSPLPACLPFSARSSHRKRLVRKIAVAASGGGRGRDEGGELVDESMIVLRMRIREMKMSERSESPPDDWMEWEKKYYEHYNEDVCQGVGLLQSYLMNMRPGLALGFLAAVTLSVAMSIGLVTFHAAEMAKGIFSGLHLS